MGLIVELDPGFVQRDKRGRGIPLRPGNRSPARPRSADGVGTRSRRSPKRTGSGAPFRRVASVTVRGRDLTSKSGQPAAAGARPTVRFRGRPLPRNVEGPKAAKAKHPRRNGAPETGRDYRSRARVPNPPARPQPRAVARAQSAKRTPRPRPNAPLRISRFMIILSPMPTARAINALLLSLTG